MDHNDILMGSPSDGAYALGWVMTLEGGNIYDPAANNSGHDNRYWYPSPEDASARYAREGGSASLDAFNDTPGEEDATYLSDAEKGELATANGIPRLP